ncbi:hypothetical protein [uncultured Amnibacterium sp.]|uniref:hypothetical protein n=1 Tax=uncultured Amnibacterium sp. TaxID=1631851 RepID=UPI0035CAFE06
MGSIERYSSGGDRRYRVRYRDPERRSKAKAGFVTRREAEAFLNAVSTSVAHGAYIDPTDARATIVNLGPKWLDAQTHLKPSSYATLETAWRVYVAPRWGETEVGRIRHSDVQASVAQLIKGTAPSIHPQHPLGATSVIRAYGVLASILDPRHRRPRSPAQRKPCTRCPPATQARQTARVPQPSAGRAARPVRKRQGDARPVPR